jgi:hypothetical protein
MFTVKASVFLLPCVTSSETCCGKYAEAAKTIKLTCLQLVSVFQYSVTHSRATSAARQAILIEPEVFCGDSFEILIVSCHITGMFGGHHFYYHDPYGYNDSSDDDDDDDAYYFYYQ